MIFLQFSCPDFLLSGRPVYRHFSNRLVIFHALNCFCNNIHVGMCKDAGSIDEAVMSLIDAGLMQPLQPVLFRAQDKFWIKADHTAILVSDFSCFAYGVEALVHFMFVCHVHYHNLQYH